MNTNLSFFNYFETISLKDDGIKKKERMEIKGSFTSVSLYKWNPFLFWTLPCKFSKKILNISLNKVLFYVFYSNFMYWILKS